MELSRIATLIRLLNLLPHPEGGHYAEIFRSSDLVTSGNRSRSAGTAIHFLLARGETSRWHVVDADEIWHFNEGDPIELWTFNPRSRSLHRALLAAPDESGARPMVVVPRGVWQAARPLGDYTLVGCTVSPGFEFSGFSLCADLPESAAAIAAMPEELHDMF